MDINRCAVRAKRETHQRLHPTWVLFCATLAACAAPTQSTNRPGASAGSGSFDAGVIPAMPVCAADNPFCAPPPPTGATSTGTAPTTPTTPPGCGSVPLDLRPSGVNIMVAVDGSAGMATHWSDIATAIRSLRASNPNASFGVHLFWGDPVDLSMVKSDATNGCAAVHNQFLELGNHSSSELVAALGSGPLGGMITGYYQVSPIAEPLSYYLTNATKLSDPNSTNYLLVFTAGNDNCFGSAFVDPSLKQIVYHKLAVELSQRNIRTIPIGVDPPSTVDAGPALGPVGTSTSMGGFLGFGATITAPTTDYASLATLLKYGGSGLPEVPRIDTAANLAALVSKVGATVSNCRFEVPPSLDSSSAVNPFELSFSINNVVVPRDRHQQNGWDFVHGSTKQVEFFGQGCQALQVGQNVVANKACALDICGTAAVSAHTKPRSVLFLLDSSVARIQCTDGTANCVTMQPGTPGRPFSFWETVQRAVSEALIAPVNDDVAFGMQFFPSKTAAALSCDVAAQPEIPPAAGEQLVIMKQMLEKFPFGLSPDITVMENVAAAPGKLADPGVVGSVVLLSEGGDNCSGATQPNIVARLGAAAKKLFDAGVKTYAIRYGSPDGESADQAAQLAAIVTNGGTAISGAAVPYIDAKSPDDLTNALAALSDRLASCSFALSGVSTNVDKERTNLFLNGEQIGLDAKGAKQQGWNWVDPARTTVELYGDACTTFKTSLQTRVDVEFGCQAVISPD
jgi:hypothetical protein